MHCVDVLVICYNSLPHILETTQAYLESEGVQCRVLVVDNASTDGAADEIERTFGYGQVDVLRLDKNVGYGGAINAAWPRTSSEWVLISNADVIPASDMVRELLTTAEKTSAAAVAPSLSYLDGTPQPAFASARSGLWPKREPAAQRDLVLAADQYLDGAVLLLSSAAFRSIGGFDERFFFYGEDVALSRAFHAGAHLLAHAPAARGTHARGSDSRARSPQMLKRSAVWLASAKLMNAPGSSSRVRRRVALTESMRALFLLGRNALRHRQSDPQPTRAFQRMLLREYLAYVVFGHDPACRHRQAIDL